jgi:hypothetical protein
MPTSNPRLSVTLQPSLDAILRRMSELTGQSKSAMVADLLESSVPVFERMCIVLEAAKQAQNTLKESTLQGLDDAEKKLHEQLGITMDIFHSSTLPIVEQAEEIRRRGKASGGTASRSETARRTPLPPYVTRGSGTPKTGKNNKTTTTSKASGMAKTASGKRKAAVKG